MFDNVFLSEHIKIIGLSALYPTFPYFHKCEDNRKHIEYATDVLYIYSSPFLYDRFLLNLIQFLHLMNVITVTSDATEI